MKFLIPVLFLVASTEAFGQPYGYTYVKSITIQNSQVTGTVNHANFPVLISVTDNNLRTTGFGGHVTNANGYDIVFTSSDCLTTLDHQIESYTANTGTYVAWVRVPVLNATANTVIHMYYGNSSVSTNPSTTSTWNNNYKAVWHFSNSVADFTANGNNLTNFSTTNLATGKIGQGRFLDNNTNVLSSNAGQYLRLANGFLSGVTNFTFEGWVYMNRANTNWERIFDFGQSTNVNFFLCPSTGNGNSATSVARITINTNANEQGPVSGNSISTGAWVHWAVVLNDATNTMTLYKNGAVHANAAGSVTLTPNSVEASTANYFGRSQYGADHYIDAQFDEFRISTSVRSADWILTSYNNQNNPGAFHVFSAEAAAATLCAPLPIELLNFKATPIDDRVNVEWTTLTETNNDFFTVERSQNGLDWEEIATVSGAGNSTKKLNYSIADDEPYNGRSYYKLRQTDYNGLTSYSPTVVVNISNDSDVNIYSNSVARTLNVEYEGTENHVYITIYNMIGKQVFLSATHDVNKTTFSTIGLSAGVYLVIVNYGGQKISKKVFIR